MSERGIPENARRLDELLREREQWEENVQKLFHATRTSLGMNQTQLANELGISQSYVSEIESGAKTPSSGTLNKLYSFMGGVTTNATAQVTSTAPGSFTVTFGEQDNEQATASDPAQERSQA